MPKHSTEIPDWQANGDMNDTFDVEILTIIGVEQHWIEVTPHVGLDKSDATSACRAQARRTGKTYRVHCPQTGETFKPSF